MIVQIELPNVEDVVEEEVRPSRLVAQHLDLRGLYHMLLCDTSSAFLEWR